MMTTRHLQINATFARVGGTSFNSRRQIIFDTCLSVHDDAPPSQLVSEIDCNHHNNV